MQWAAILTMLIDHIGNVWYPDSAIWRIVGRFAFPIYAYYIALGMWHTRHPKRYLLRLLLLAVVSQLPFSLLFDTWTVNVIGTFFVSVAAIFLAEQTSGLLRFGWILAACLLMTAVPFDYGIYGLALIMIYRYTASHSMWLAHAGLNLVYVVTNQVFIQMFSIIPTWMFSVWPNSSRLVQRTVPRWLWRSFYPAHLLALYLLTFVIP